VYITTYQDNLKSQWDSFVAESKNGTFLLQRDYMEYHSNRFQDLSLLCYDDKHKLLAVFPANIHQNIVTSHAGLSYGGFIYDSRMTQPLMVNIFQALITYCLEKQVTHVFYKSIPRIYHKGPAGEDRYVLFLLNALLKRRDCLTVIERDYPMTFQKRRQRVLNKSKKCQFSVERSLDWESYWGLLEQNLQDKHGVAPVHTVSEISYLAQQFPENIKLYICHVQGQLLAGVVIYETEKVAHFQYIAANEPGKSLGALDWLFAVLIQNIYSEKQYIDFGSSNEQSGLNLNQGLVDFKEGFGGRTVEHDFYQIEITPMQATVLQRAMI